MITRGCLLIDHEASTILFTSFHLCPNDLIATTMYSGTKRTLSRQSTLLSIHPFGKHCLVIILLYLEGNFPCKFPSVFSVLFITLGSLHTSML
jgi:hypothetical protein